MSAVQALRGPLRGMRVLELGSFIAGPYCASILGSFGAEVIKVEPASGDQIRGWRECDASGTSYWWRSLARNKLSVCIDLRKEDGRQLVMEMLPHCDVLVENFRPGRMEEWGLGPNDLQDQFPTLVYTRVSGYGQTGPLASRPGFASACEAMGGLRHVNGFPGEPSVRPNLSLGDTLAGQQAAMGTLLALLARERGVVPDRNQASTPPLQTLQTSKHGGSTDASKTNGGAGGGVSSVNGADHATGIDTDEDAGGGRSRTAAEEGGSGGEGGGGPVVGPVLGQYGQVVDASIIESVFAMLEGVLPEYSGNGSIRGPSGSSVTGIVPTGTYPCGDGSSVVIGGNSNTLFKRLTTVMGRVDMAANDEAYGSNELRVANQAEIDAAITRWTLSQQSASAVCAILDEVEVPNGKIFSIADIAADPHVQERGMIETVTIDNDWELDIPAVTPRLGQTPGGTAWPGRSSPGEDTTDVLVRMLGKSTVDIAALKVAGTIS